MDARLTDEQETLRETAREFIEDAGGTETARRKMAGEEGVVDELWSELASLDYMAITAPLACGGFGEGMVHLAALLEALGRYAVPGPYPETLAFAVPLINLVDEERQAQYVEPIIAGDRRLSLALYDDRHAGLPDAITMRGDRTEDGFRLKGTKTLVPYGGAVDDVIVAARTQDGTGFDGLSLFLVDPSRPEIETTQLDSLDQTRPMYELQFEEALLTEDALLGPVHEGGDALARAIDRYAVAAYAMLVGAADRAVELSAEHGRERTQYGHPVGRFQAVKHRIVEMQRDAELARSLVYYAAWALDTDAPDARLAVAQMHALAGERLPGIFADDIYNHGGMGFTWDHDAHIYLKQARAWKAFLGGPDRHLERVADIRGYEDGPLAGYPELTVEPYR